MLIPLLTVAAIVATIGLAVALYVLVSLVRDRAPYVATPDWVCQYLARHLPENTHQFVDLGCGDGRVLRAVKRARPDVAVVGHERNWLTYVVARVRCRSQKCTITRSSFYDADLSRADVVYCFLVQSVMKRVGTLLHARCRPGTIIYSYAFIIPGWTPEVIIAHPTDPARSKLYRYRLTSSE